MTEDTTNDAINRAIRARAGRPAPPVEPGDAAGGAPEGDAPAPTTNETANAWIRERAAKTKETTR